jgi:hypothetical protein
MALCNRPVVLVVTLVTEIERVLIENETRFELSLWTGHAYECCLKRS